MIPDRLILRETNSPFVTPYNDTNLNGVLSRKQLDGNFIYLKGETIYSAETTGNSVILKKLNGNDVIVDLTNFTGGTGTGTTEQDNKFRYFDIGSFMLGGRGADVSNPSALFDERIEYYLANNLSLTVNDDELIVILVEAIVYGTFYRITRKYLFPNLLGKGTYNAGDFTLDDLELVFETSEYNTVIEDGVNVTIYPLNNDMEISGLTSNCEDFYTLINSSGPYPIGDVNTNYFFRFLCHGVTYIYFYDPITGGLDPDFVGTGYPATNSFDYTLFYNSSLPDINDDNVLFSGTYSTLQTLAVNNQLEVGRKYILTDYQTKYIINGSDSSTRQQTHTIIGSAGAYSQFSNVPSTIAANGDIVTVVFAPVGASVVSGQTLTIIDYFNTGFIRFSPTVTGANNIGVQIRFEKQRYLNIPNNSVINDINAKPVIKPGGVLNTEVHDGLPYMSMSGSENPSPIIEQIVLTAIDTDTFSQNAESLTFVGDSLLYDFNNNIINDDNGNFVTNKNGTILKRTNVNNTISVNKDWRVQRYRRYRMDDTNWNQYLLRKELSGLSGTSGSTIYKISTVNYCTNNNTTITNEHRYIVSEPYITGFYTDFAKTVNNPFLSGTTTAPTITIGARLPVITHTTEYSVDMSLPLSGFSGTTLGRDLHIIPISSGNPTSSVTLFKVKNLSNTIITTNSQRYGASQNIYVDSENGFIVDSSFTTAPIITSNTNEITKFNSIEHINIRNSGRLNNINNIGYHAIDNKGFLMNVTLGQGFIGSGVNEYTEYNFADTCIISDCIFGSNRIDGFTIDLMANRSLIINRTVGISSFNGKLYLTLYKNFGDVYGSTIEMDTYVNQIPSKGYFGYVYDFNTSLSDLRAHNFNDSKHLIREKIDSSFITSFITVASVL